jgi:hypothetical protein
MKVVNYFWYKVVESNDFEDRELLFKTRKDVATYLGLTVPKVRYYSSRKAINPRTGVDVRIVKLTSATKVPVMRHEAIEPIFVRPKFN